MNRDDFPELAHIRLKEAKILLDNECWEGAYYLCGYAVECSLKACISKKTKEHDFPPPRSMIEKYYTHNLKLLMEAAGLNVQLRSDIEKDKNFRLNWIIVESWNESSRYERIADSDARDLYLAVSNSDHGVLKWIKQYW
ncbi:MAG TPA: HEPN domain-containing protein [Methanotrichaceae archaeon]|nr:HEPN domain-containing protein [Methanotrichaceae archaeon]